MFCKILSLMLFQFLGVYNCSVLQLILTKMWSPVLVMPVLTSPPRVTLVKGSNRLDVTWLQWKVNVTGVGTGPIESYTLQRLRHSTDVGRMSWQDVVTMNHSSSFQRYLYQVDKLPYDSLHKFRVQLAGKDNDNGKAQPSVPGPESQPWVFIPCAGIISVLSRSRGSSYRVQVLLMSWVTAVGLHTMCRYY